MTDREPDSEPELSPLPSDLRTRELWLQHAVGFEVMRQVREPARARAANRFTGKTLEQVYDLVDKSIYDLFMLVEGIPDLLHNDEHRIVVDWSGASRRLPTAQWSLSSHCETVTA